MTSPLVAAAYDYLALGLRIIALTGKAPNTAVHRHGIKDALTGREGVLAAFEHPETTGIGIATGMPYYVVDIDGEVGAYNWQVLMENDPEWMDGITWSATTGKGLHLWFAHWEQWPGSILAPNIDFKSAGGYVAAPPSVHPSGRIYEWLVEPSASWPPIELPEPVVRLFEARRFEAERNRVTKVARTNMRGRYTAGDGTTYVTQSFAGVFKRVAEEAEGNRNHVLYWAARTLLEEGADDADFEELLTVTTLPRREALRTIRSAFDAYE